jgi:hypothetical protein
MAAGALARRLDPALVSRAPAHAAAIDAAHEARADYAWPPVTVTIALRACGAVRCS